MKSFSVIFLIIFGLSVGFSQEDSNSNFWNNVSFGGGIGLNFSDVFFSGTLAPQAIYNFNPYFSAGLGLSGSYSSQKDVFKSTILGGRILALTNPFSELQLSVELEQVNVSTSFQGMFSSYERDDFWATALFIGAGYRTGNVTFGVRYNILYDEDESIYADSWLPFVRFWF